MAEQICLHLTQGMWSNIYNSVLSSIGTPLKAGLSNLSLMIERPIATFEL